MSIMDEYRIKAQVQYPEGKKPMRAMMSDAVHSKDMPGMFGKKKKKGEEEDDKKKGKFDFKKKSKKK